MAKKTEISPEQPIDPDHIGVVDAPIVHEMRTAYLDYAMSVIVSRALPDIRDGMKPVHRRILFAMNNMGLTASSRFRKSALIVGDVLGKYHPHGDSAVYETMVKMAQPFSYRYPIIMGQGNFGSIDGDAAAAMRYTEAKMHKMAGELMRDIEKGTVDFRPNYDGSRKEPSVLPAAVPQLLLNGTLGIAVGMASNIPPHNLREVINATLVLLDNPEATLEDLLEHVKGPDFPMGGIIFDKKAIAHAYATGRGGVVCRGEAEIVETKSGQSEIIITSIPYRVNKAELILKVANLVQEKKLEGIRDIRDESAKGDIRVVVFVKSGVPAQSVLNQLYKHTELESTFHFNTVALVDSIPQTLGLKSMLEEFIKYRKEVIRRRTEFDLNKAKDREHILLGLKKALDHIDEIIQTIKKSKDTLTAHTNLMKDFKFSDRQATAILEMKLQKLAGLERKKIEDDLKAVQDLIKELESILGSAKKILQVIREDITEIRDKYGDDRRTKVVAGTPKNISLEDMIPEQETVVVFSNGGYIKRTLPTEYRVQKRGGVGVMDLETKEEDFIRIFLSCSTHDDLLFFTNRGRVYQLKAYQLPEGKRATKGKSVANFLQITPEEKITSIIAMPKDVKTQKDAFLFMVTKMGTAKKTVADAFADVRSTGIICINLDKNDELLQARFVEGKDEISCVTKEGMSIRFANEDVRAMGRTAGGVAGMKLGKGDEIVGVDVIRAVYKDKALILVLSETGYGKMTLTSEYKTQGRAGSGIKTANVTEKLGAICASAVVPDQEAELIVMSKNGQVIRTPLADIPVLARSTQGVRIMKLREGDSIASITLI
jgi:DNA gyrase subunit A